MSFAAQRAPEPPPAPQMRIRGRSFVALVVTPEFPMAEWFAALDEQLRASRLLLERPVVVDLAAMLAIGGPEAVPIVLEGLEARGLRFLAVEGVTPAVLAATRWDGLAGAMIGGRSAREVELDATPAAEPPLLGEPEVPAAHSLLIDQPVRSGQSVVFQHGDVTVLGSVASGAEVIAGGSIHIYGTLRGRAIAGLRDGDTARIFCRRMEAEMVGVALHYRTAEHWGAGLQGQAVQVWCDRGSLRLSTLD